MKAEDFAYVVDTKKNFEDAAVAVLKAADKKGWALFNVYDVKERLAAKGFRQGPLKIIELCSAKYANRFISKNKLVSLCIPCKINVLEEKGKVKIIGMRPTMLAELFPEFTKEEVADAEQEVKSIIDSAK